VSAFNLFQISVHLIEAIKILNVSVVNTEIIPEKSSLERIGRLSVTVKTYPRFPYYGVFAQQ